MSRFWSKQVHQLNPYVPGEQPKHPNLVKLNTNENPYPPSPKAIAAINTAASDNLRLYPDPESTALRQVLADHAGLQADNIFVGNGSDEVLALAFQALLKQDKPLLLPDISYSFYPVYCNLYQVDYLSIPLAGDFSINIADYQRDSGAVILPNPNAPTGLLLSLDAIETLLGQNPDRPVIIDEAYVDFGGESAASLIPRHDNLLVIQTLSKSRSLAGLRVGWAMGHRDLIDGLERTKNSFNSYPLDRLAQAGAIAALTDNDHFCHCRDSIIANRDQLARSLRERHFTILPSAANFLFVSPANGKAADLAEQLRQRGIIIRHFTHPERISDWLRISIGTNSQHQALLDALDEILGQ